MEKTPDCRELLEVHRNVIDLESIEFLMILLAPEVSFVTLHMRWHKGCFPKASTKRDLFVWVGGGQLRAFIHFSKNIPFPKTRPRSPESSSDCCSTVRMLNYLTCVSWKRGIGTSFLPFIGWETGVSRNLQAVSKVHFQILFT